MPARSDVRVCGGAGTEELQDFPVSYRFNTDSWICDLKIANTGYYHNVLKISL